MNPFLQIQVPGPEPVCGGLRRVVREETVAWVHRRASEDHARMHQAVTRMVVKKDTSAAVPVRGTKRERGLARDGRVAKKLMKVE